METIIQQMTPDSIIHRLGHVSQLAAAPADLLLVLVEASVGACFLLLFKIGTNSSFFFFFIVSKMMISEK